MRRVSVTLLMYGGVLGRASLIIGLLLATSCGDPATTTPHFCSKLRPAPCEPLGVGGRGGAGGEAGSGGQSAGGGGGGAGEAEPSTETVIANVILPECFAWSGTCDWGPEPRLELGLEYTYLKANWDLWMAYRPPLTPFRPPDRVEVCVRTDYVEREVVRVVGACVAPPEYEIILGPEGEWEALSVAVGSIWIDPEFWWYREVRLYFDPVDATQSP